MVTEDLPSPVKSGISMVTEGLLQPLSASVPTFWMVTKGPSVTILRYDGDGKPSVTIENFADFVNLFNLRQIAFYARVLHRILVYFISLAAVL